MLKATLLKPRSQAVIQPGSSSSSRKSRMFQRRASRYRRSSFPATQPVEADCMETLADEIIPVAPAIADINVVGVAHDMPSRQDCTRPADIGPKGFVDSAIAAPVESVAAVPGMAPACADAASIEVAPTLTPVEETTTTLPTMAADVKPEMEVMPEIVTAAPDIADVIPSISHSTPPTSVAIAPADTIATGALPATPKKTQRPRRKPENEGLGDGAGKTKKPRRKSAKELSATWTPDLAKISNGAHSP